jgi:hypothetical protein
MAKVVVAPKPDDPKDRNPYLEGIRADASFTAVPSVTYDEFFGGRGETRIPNFETIVFAAKSGQTCNTYTLTPRPHIKAPEGVHAQAPRDFHVMERDANGKITGYFDASFDYITVGSIVHASKTGNVDTPLGNVTEIHVKRRAQTQ